MTQQGADKQPPQTDRRVGRRRGAPAAGNALPPSCRNNMSRTAP